MALNLGDQVNKYPIWFSKVNREWLFSIRVFALRVMWEVLIFWGTPRHHSNEIHGVRVYVCVCERESAFRECLTFSQHASLTQRPCHTFPIQLIAVQSSCQSDWGSSLTFVLLNICLERYTEAFWRATDTLPCWNQTHSEIKQYFLSYLKTLWNGSQSLICLCMLTWQKRASR